VQGRQQRELWEINDIVDGVYEELLKADRKVWSDPCKHRLSSEGEHGSLLSRNDDC
jgi:hypothetical protein